MAEYVSLQTANKQIIIGIIIFCVFELAIIIGTVIIIKREIKDIELNPDLYIGKPHPHNVKRH